MQRGAERSLAALTETEQLGRFAANLAVKSKAMRRIGMPLHNEADPSVRAKSHQSGEHDCSTLGSNRRIVLERTGNRVISVDDEGTLEKNGVFRTGFRGDKETGYAPLSPDLAKVRQL